MSNLPIPESYWVVKNRFLAGEHPINYYAEDTPLRIASFLQAGINTFVDLTDLGELTSYEKVLAEQARLRHADASYAQFPIVNRSLPAIQTMNAILDFIDNALDGGRKVYVHCWGGIGRTGTAVGCYLVRRGMNGEQALGQIADWWKHVPKHARYPNSPETTEQADFIRRWHEYDGHIKKAE